MRYLLFCDYSLPSLRYKYFNN